MEKISYIILFLFLIGCSTTKKTKPCTQCPQYSYMEYDTTLITIPHYNYNGMCFPETKTTVVEEFFIEIDSIEQG